MIVHLFGVTSSPSCANFALYERLPEENERVFDADPGYHKKFFERGGFLLANWIYTSFAASSQSVNLSRAPSMSQLDFHKSKYTERPPVAQWNVPVDKFNFSTTIKDTTLIN